MVNAAGGGKVESLVRGAFGTMCSDLHRAESGTEVRGAGVGAREKTTGPRAGGGGRKRRGLAGGAARGLEDARHPGPATPAPPLASPCAPQPPGAAGAA